MPHHHAAFEMNERGLPIGLRLALATMLKSLAG
jgi:hypothetical protein